MRFIDGGNRGRGTLVSPNDEPCDFPATVHCAKCGRWFCDAHAEDEEWHPYMLRGSDGGGEE